MNLLTGATGLVGAHLLAQLILNKEQTRALFRTESKKQKAMSVVYKYGISPEDIAHHVEWMQCDILDLPKLELAFVEVNLVYHCAGFISNSPSDYTKMRQVNIEGTANVANLSLASSVRKLCHVSSIASLGKASPEGYITEETPLAEDEKPSAYEISKYGAEMEVWRASQEGLDVVIVNPGIILGDGFYESGSGLLVSKLKNGLKYYPPKISGFVGVYDVASICVLLMKSSSVNERYIVVSENLSFYKVRVIFANCFQNSSPAIRLSPWMLYFAWCLEVLRSFFTSYKRQLTLEVISSLFKDSIYSNAKLKEEFDFQFESLDEVAKKIQQRS